MAAMVAVPDLRPCLFQCPLHSGEHKRQVQRVVGRKLVPEPGRVGRNRVVLDEDLPAYRTALIVAGFLKGDEAEPTAR